jgi:hypothetical protein
MKTTLTLDIDYDPDITDPEALACAMDRLMETALSTPGIMEDYGNPRIGEFFVADANPDSALTRPLVVAEVSGGVLQTIYASDPAIGAVLVDYDTERGNPAEDEGLVEITDAQGRPQLVYATRFPVTEIAVLPGTETGQVLDRAGIAYNQADHGVETELARRWVLYDQDQDCLLTTEVYRSYEEAAEAAAQANDVLVVPLVWQEVQL